ncbi:MAG: hypothetical protein ACERKN_02000 [Velocimicrobium sp.]
MKFKYKKMILMITMGTMLIGFVVFSTVSPKKDEVTSMKTEETQEEQQEIEVPTPTPTIDTSVIQKDLNTEVSKVVKDYLIASVACDMDALEDTLNDISMLSEDELKLKYEYVESVSNMECYMIPDPNEDGFLVYAYRELKLKDINTLAPGLSRVYVKIGDNGEYRVFFGADTGLEDFINETDQSSEVRKLVEKVNTKMEEAISADKDLKAFIDKISVAGKKQEEKDADSNE